jgi:hypothetical protein
MEKRNQPRKEMQAARKTTRVTSMRRMAVDGAQLPRPHGQSAPLVHAPAKPETAEISWKDFVPTPTEMSL